MEETARLEEILQGLSRSLNLLNEDNRASRKGALERIQKEVASLGPQDATVVAELSQNVMNEVLKKTSDPVEKCRDLAIGIVRELFQKHPQPEKTLKLIIPALVARLGQQEMLESSEEIRLIFVQFLTEIVKRIKKGMFVYLDDMVKILQRTVADPFPEVKKESCVCASLLANSCRDSFHMQSESLVRPLLQSFGHQHSKVRVAAIEATGQVILYGSSKSVDDVLASLAQRLFDQSHPVRRAIVDVIGLWLLELPDRYSFFHKLIPLLLTGLADDFHEIRQRAEELWWDVGIKYERENEDELKDMSNFDEEPEHYPAGKSRPNVGCRELIHRNLSRVLPALLRDLADWVPATRNIAANLLTVLMWQAETHSTQHLQALCEALPRAAEDEEANVRTQADESARLVGCFVPPSVWTGVLLPELRERPTCGKLRLLASLVSGALPRLLSAVMADICRLLSDLDLCGSETFQRDVLLTLDAILSNSQPEDVVQNGFSLFQTLVVAMAASRSEEVREKARSLLQQLAARAHLSSVDALFEMHAAKMVDQLQETVDQWSHSSPQRFVLDAVVSSAGISVVESLLDRVTAILQSCLEPERDAELRSGLFSLTSRLLLRLGESAHSERASRFAGDAVATMILPNMKWKAGRTAAAVRGTAVASLWAALQSNLLTGEQIRALAEPLQSPLNVTIEDDSQMTRLLTCRALALLYRGLTREQLHPLYPPLLKRLDDASNDVRMQVANAITAYLEAFDGQFEVPLYEAHLEAILRGLLIHLDDSEEPIRLAVLDVLKVAAALSPALLVKEVQAVRHKFKHPDLCDRLVQHVETIDPSMPTPIQE